MLESTKSSRKEHRLKDICREVLQSKNPGCRTPQDIKSILECLMFFNILPKGMCDEGIVQDICQHTALRKFPKNTLLFLQGQNPDSYFIIFSGVVDIYQSKNPEISKNLLHTFEDKLFQPLSPEFEYSSFGSHLRKLPALSGFGELSLLGKSNSKRSATALTALYSELLEIDARVYARTLKPYHLEQAHLEECVKVLESLEICQGLPSRILSDVGYQMHRVNYSARSSIASKGQPIEKVMVVSSGDVREIKAQKGLLKDQAVLGPGTLIGAKELFTNSFVFKCDYNAVGIVQGYWIPLQAFSTIAENSERVEKFKSLQMTREEFHSYSHSRRRAASVLGKPDAHLSIRERISDILAHDTSQAPGNNIAIFKQHDASILHQVQPVSSLARGITHTPLLPAASRKYSTALERRRTVTLKPQSSIASTSEKTEECTPVIAMAAVVSHWQQLAQVQSLDSSWQEERSTSTPAGTSAANVFSKWQTLSKQSPQQRTDASVQSSAADKSPVSAWLSLPVATKSTKQTPFLNAIVFTSVRNVKFSSLKIILPNDLDDDEDDWSGSNDGLLNVYPPLAPKNKDSRPFFRCHSNFPWISQPKQTSSDPEAQLQVLPDSNNAYKGSVSCEQSETLNLVQDAVLPSPIAVKGQSSSKLLWPHQSGSDPNYASSQKLALNFGKLAVSSFSTLIGQGLSSSRVFSSRLTPIRNQAQPKPTIAKQGKALSLKVYPEDIAKTIDDNMGRISTPSKPTWQKSCPKLDSELEKKVEVKAKSPGLENTKNTGRRTGIDIPAATISNLRSKGNEPKPRSKFLSIVNKPKRTTSSIFQNSS